ncbi:MAG: succinate dehydrogenase [Bacteroidetes bacterium]|nr:MAG: succinate dehydrogenase [Bacteroidota bacterium]
MKGGIFSGSVGHKLIMSITGLFLVLFLLVHLSMNLTLMLNNVDMFGQHWGEGDMFNTGAHFMISTPLIRVMEPLLAAGFILHIAYGAYITWRNRKFRPVKYAVSQKNEGIEWTGKNMFILGLLVLAFLCLHLINFFWRFRYGAMPTVELHGVVVDDSYSVVAGLFRSSVLYCLVYIAASVLLALHLSHGFWSAFQTIGWSNQKWFARLRVASIVYAVIIGVGFSSIPLYFMLVK